MMGNAPRSRVTIMGLKNSSETRVRPVFNELIDRSPTGETWLQPLCDMARRTRESDAPTHVGHLLSSKTPTERDRRLGSVFERTVAPPSAFLQWLLRNADRMQVSD